MGDWIAQKGSNNSSHAAISEHFVVLDLRAIKHEAVAVAKTFSAIFEANASKVQIVYFQVC